MALNFDNGAAGLWHGQVGFHSGVQLLGLPDLIVIDLLMRYILQVLLQAVFVILLAAVAEAIGIHDARLI